MNVVLNNESWRIKRTRPTRARRGTEAPIPPEFLAADVTVDEVIEATPVVAARRGGDVPVVDLTVEPDPETACVLAVRHPSGALTFHFGEATAMIAPRRGAARASGTRALRFRI